MLKLVYVESLDLLLVACEDGCIYVWGIDEEGVQILRRMKYEEEKANAIADNEDMQNYIKFYMKINNSRDRDSFDINESAEPSERQEAKSPPKETASKVDETDSVTNRVAGFVLKKILCEHSSCVTSLVVIERPSKRAFHVYKMHVTNLSIKIGFLIPNSEFV